MGLFVECPLSARSWRRTHVSRPVGLHLGSCYSFSWFIRFDSSAASSRRSLYLQWQVYLRQHKPRILVVWGKHDPVFSVSGAMAIQRELPSSKVHILDAGHFALDDAAEDVAGGIRDFLR
ncbi:alpha/beta fold hydrolase [Herbaspirillum seropedicae]|uniref:alpha/beta fold hydrolase n=1 Tax=Herbaspirillum seropedicae TaxID=964 RepID=UPI003F8CFF50